MTLPRAVRARRYADNPTHLSTPLSSTQRTLSNPLPDPQIPLFPGVGAKLMGELRRGAASWDVFLECESDRVNGATRGRLHFVSGGRTVTTAWIFLEWTARDVEARFHEFGAAELWGLVEGISS